MTSRHSISRTSRARTIGHMVGAASRVEADFFCKRCKGHYSGTFAVTGMNELRCRCGSDDLLIYSMVGDLNAPLRSR